MSATPNTAEFKSGYAATVTIGSVSWAKAKAIRLPKIKGSTVKTPHLSGLSVTPDGDTDFGQLVIMVAEDGTASPARNAQVSCSCTLTSISKTLSGTGVIVGVDYADAERGKPLERTITVDADSEWTWA